MKDVCPICGYVYDDSAGQAWNELPDDWKCPLCGAPKAVFRPEGGQEQKVEEVAAPAEQGEVRPLSAAELSAVCSSLAKGCEKQYRPDQAEAFRRIAQWLKNRAGKAPDPSFGKILEKVEQDIAQYYPEANSAAAVYGDRGALRSLTWSSKVTLMLQSLLTRFGEGREELPENTGVYVCTVCGFVYVGDSLPEVCPVCKVPNSKFEKIGG